MPPPVNKKRFGRDSSDQIDQELEKLTPLNTKKCRASAWKQFEEFCLEKEHIFGNQTPTTYLAIILKDFAFNMRRKDGTEYKETVVKTMWNIVVKLLMEKYYKEFNIKFDPFKDIVFACARNARDANRKRLQTNPEQLKTSAANLTQKEYDQIISIWDENTPEGLQKKFNHIASYELAWRGGEATSCLISYFKEELNNCGEPIGRVAYNPVFGKTTQGGAHPLAETKWLIKNTKNSDRCPVRLFRKLMEHRTKHITTDRLFLTVNPLWKNPNSVGFFKNSPIGRNTISNWTRTSVVQSN